MISTGTPEANSTHCSICTQLAGAADAVCANCGNQLTFSDPALMPITLSAFPVLDRAVLDRIRTLFNDVKPKRLRLDFAQVQLPAPAVYASFLLLVKDVKKTGSVLAVCHVDPKIHDMFVITRIDSLIEKEA